MAFKMKGFPMHRGTSGFKKAQTSALKDAGHGNADPDHIHYEEEAEKRIKEEQEKKADESGVEMVTIDGQEYPADSEYAIVWKKEQEKKKKKEEEKVEEKKEEEKVEEKKEGGVEEDKPKKKSFKEAYENRDMDLYGDLTLAEYTKEAKRQIAGGKVPTEKMKTTEKSTDTPAETEKTADTPAETTPTDDKKEEKTSKTHKELWQERKEKRKVRQAERQRRRKAIDAWRRGGSKGEMPQKSNNWGQG